MLRSYICKLHVRPQTQFFLHKKTSAPSHTALPQAQPQATRSLETIIKFITIIYYYF